MLEGPARQQCARRTDAERAHAHVAGRRKAEDRKCGDAADCRVAPGEEAVCDAAARHRRGGCASLDVCGGRVGAFREIRRCARVICDSAHATLHERGRQYDRQADCQQDERAAEHPARQDALADEDVHRLERREAARDVQREHLPEGALPDFSDEPTDHACLRAAAGGSEA